MKSWSLGAIVLSQLVFAISSNAQKEKPAANKTVCTVQAEMTGAIGPVTVDLVKRVNDFAVRESCGSILYLVNTPGGSLESTRIVVEKILNSPVPVLCLVAPSGGHAGSAGAIILQACHVNGALRGTNLGAATPVSMGQDLPKDLRQKIMNDTRSWLESLTKLRGRSEKFGQDIILEAKAVSAEEALKLKAIDFVGDSVSEFLKFSDQRSVKLSENKEIKVPIGDIKAFLQDMRYKVLALLTDPQFAYMLLLGSLALLYFEFTHPGAIIPGVIGGLGLVVAMVALHKLDVEWGGLLLIFLGIAMLVAEMFVPSFGFLGVGGIAAFVLGSIFLFDPVKSWGYRLPLSLIMPVVVVVAAMFLGIGYLMLRTVGLKKRGGFEDLIGVSAQVVSVEGDGHRGLVELRGETWSFISEAVLNLQDPVTVKSHKGMILVVEKEAKS